MSTQSANFVYTPTSSGTYTWRFRRVHSGANAPASSYTLDNLKVSYIIPYTRTECPETDLAYRFGFNGYEKDNEVKGEGNSLDFGERIYDTRIGRFLSTDPDQLDYPFQSPYLFAANSPISHKDEKGKFAQLVIQYGANVAINVGMQMLTSMMFDDDVKDLGGAWDKVSMLDAMTEGAADMVGTKKFQMAFNAAKSMFDYIDEVGMDNVTPEGLIANGAMGLIEPMLGKYDAGKVAKGLAKLGIDAKKLEKIYGKGSTWKGAVDYSDLPDSKTVGAGKKYTQTQKQKILDKNKKANDGYLRSDKDGEFLNKAKKGGSEPKQAEVDHKQAKGGSNSNKNAQVLSKKQNGAKGSN